MKEKVYYIGFNANNAICNESFFEGSITLYPTNERGNIYYSERLLTNTKSDEFMNAYREFIYNTATKLQHRIPNVRFICFNEKAIKLCSSMNGITIIKNNDLNVIQFLNNKFKIREFIKNEVPILDYYFYDSQEINYSKLANKLTNKKLVVQESIGAGGDTTYLINNEKDLLNVKKNNCNYCVSEYIKNIPLNITLIIGDNDIRLLPISVQLIKVINNRFKYVGADFKHVEKLSHDVIEKTYRYSKIIGNKVKKTGYRGILGIDYILTQDDNIIFMEINPRFQASSFLISRKLEEYFNTNIAKLHYQAMTNQKLDEIGQLHIGESFVNCNKNQPFENITYYELVTNGYFKDNPSSYYRKVLKRSIIHEDNFENIN